jgi:hypothetical protein
VETPCRMASEQTKRGVLWVERVASGRSWAILAQSFSGKCGTAHKAHRSGGDALFAEAVNFIS